MDHEIRIPPHNLEAESSVLGGLLIDKDAIVKVAEFLRPEHFYKDLNGSVYKAILNLFEKGEPSDLVTVPDELKRMKVLKEIGGVSYLTELVNFVPTAANVEYYANIIKEHAIRRFLIKVSSRIGELGFKEDIGVSSLLDEAEQLLYGVSQDQLREEFVPIKETLEVTFERLDEMHKKKGSLRGVPTGFKTLDNMLSGLQDSNLSIIAARPSIGKSSLLINFCQFAAVKHKIPVGIFSLEMSREQVVDRMISAQGDIDNWRITTGNLEEEDFEKYSNAAGELAEAPIFIDDTPGINIMEMRTKARRLQIDQKVRLIIVDYLQLIHGRNLENRVQEVSEISQALKNLARELKIPVIAASQLSRAVEQRGGDKRPQLSDLRESGSIEQDADVVMFLYRPDEEDRENIKLLISKHRNGPTGELDLYFKGNRTKFYEADTAH
ncbi:replicative DNA helicase [candidate division WWE3 bacterium RIFCSPHIGHO2_01_FULL_40_23]|uniref:Replicative DNA helicase n=1 Tax=candidate division WWE3 bacterium RIFCSPLOWO2_01_FULL_41_18 TaxID=1802625 RepID=A0A1F4VDU6_UNCKA|nr:MAG: replicative DNA helicase [candidate division WWE3 bacterium RIFCSPHIGHO2_01_FULL_40_23]OGC55456.1 MAG: replicative DNA helicase [candidate division WWE3 bacterium RIFCSPLOWO2_01_FULL_41_18]